MTKKPIKHFMQQQQLKPSQQISLESILRQNQRSSVQKFSRNGPKTGSSLLLNNGQLKIKSSHGIPTPRTSFMNNTVRQPKVGRFHQQHNSNFLPSSSARSSLFLHNNSSSGSQKSSSLSMMRSSPKVQNYQYQQQTTGGTFRGGRTNSVGLAVNNSTPRVSISSIQQQIQAQQQKNANNGGIQLKPVKNVPRCHVCKRTFATNQVLQRHMTLHGPIATITESETGEFKCDVCFEEFESPFQLSKHIQQVHENPSLSSAATSPSSSGAGGGGMNRCRVCYRSFTCLDSLKAHSLLHDGDFKCRACRRGFPDWNSLEEHEATHKRYNCQWCEKYFMNSGNLKAHERIHTGERPYKCNDCPKAFKQLGGLQYHLKTNPTHKPQRYSKGELEGTGMDDGSNGAGASSGGMGYLQDMQFEESEEYDDGGNGNLSILDMAAGAGF
jgi:hypothetical protein